MFFQGSPGDYTVARAKNLSHRLDQRQLNEDLREHGFQKRFASLLCALSHRINKTVFIFSLKRIDHISLV